MNVFYFLCVWIILFQRGRSLSIDPNVAMFSKLCFLPKSPVFVSLKALTDEEKHPEIHYAEIGNDVMQHKIFEFLTDKKRKASEEDLENMCYQANVETYDDNGVVFGKLFGYQNITSNYTCQDSNDLPGVFRCNFESVSKQFDEDTLTYFTLANENFLFEIDCFKSGHVGWALYSRTPQISEEDKKFYYAHAASLGFPESTNVILHGDRCVD